MIPERQCICKITRIEVVHLVTFSFEGEDCVGAEPNTSIHPRGEVNAEEGEPRVRDLFVYINKVLYCMYYFNQPNDGIRRR